MTKNKIGTKPAIENRGYSCKEALSYGDKRIHSFVGRILAILPQKYHQDVKTVELLEAIESIYEANDLK